MRQLPGFAGSAGQGGVLTARDLLFPDSYADAFQLDMDSSQGLTLNPAFLSVKTFCIAKVYMSNFSEPIEHACKKADLPSEDPRPC